MASSEEVDGSELPELDDDYYALLNVGREATNEEINNAYRRLSRIFHPDKHSDPVQKKQAELVFNATKKAYSVIGDPHKRAIYDSLGTKGLETEGWEVVQRTKTPQEIREEYERLAREREERRLQQRTNPKGTVSITIDSTEFFEGYDDTYEERSFPQLEIKGMSISQSVEAPLTLSDTVTLSGQLHTQNGNGSGSVSCSWRRIISSKSWAEFDVGAGNGLLFSIRGFRTLTKRSFCNVAGLFHFTPHGIRPGLNAVLGRQLDKHVVGYLTWKAGINSAMETAVVWDRDKHHLAFAVQLGIASSFISLNYTHKFTNEFKFRGSLRLGTFGALLEYGCEKKVSQHSILGAALSIGVPVGVTLRIRINRGNQNYLFPVLLSEQLLPIPIFYGTVIPLVAYYAVKVLIVNPYVKQQKLREAEKHKETNAAKTAEKRREAEAAIALMQETYARNRDLENAKKGLVIIRALYGKLVTDGKSPASHNTEFVDVTVPLQCLVKDSCLVLQDSSKSQLPGFYDPCVGEDKFLYIQYKFHDLNHEVTVAEREVVRIPKQAHRVDS